MDQNRFTGVDLIVTEGAGRYLGGKTAEFFISSIEATGSSNSIAKPGFESLLLVAGICANARPVHRPIWYQYRSQVRVAGFLGRFLTNLGTIRDPGTARGYLFIPRDVE